MSDKRYFNSPIQLLDGFMIDTPAVLQNILDYSLYALTLNYQHGDELEKMKSAKNFLGINGGNDSQSYDNGEILYDSIPENSPKVGLNIDIYFDYRKNDKTEYEKICLLGFLAIKSILQSKPYCKITNKYWLSRMDGNPKSCEIEELSESIKKYANEYQTKKIKHELRDNWNLITYSRYTRGFYVSFKLPLDKLILEAEKRRKSVRQKQYRNEEKEALEKAFREIYGTRS